MGDDVVLKSFQVETCVGMIACESCGDPTDPLVLFVHGAHKNSGAQDWRTHHPILCSHDIYSVAISLPGCGVGSCRSKGQLLPYRPDLVLIPSGSVRILLDVIAQLRHANDIEYPITFIGEGYGASVCLALAQWEPQLVGALVLFQCSLSHGRFPYQRSELKALSLPVLIIWAEAEHSDGREHPQLEQSHVLAKVIPSSNITVIMKGSLDLHISEDESSSSSSSSAAGTLSTYAATTTTDALSLYKDWPSKKVYDVAHGDLAYEERAVVVVSCEEASEKAPTKEEAVDFMTKATQLRALIDIDLHHDRMRAKVANSIANFVNAYLEDNDDDGGLNETSASKEQVNGSKSRNILRHGFGLYHGTPVELDPEGHGILAFGGTPLEVGEEVLAAKRLQLGSHEAIRQFAAYRVEATAAPNHTSSRPNSKQKPRPQIRQPEFSWAFPEAVAESNARGAVELGVMPLLDGALTPGRIVGVGAAGKSNTFAIEYEDGDIESAVHRLRIASSLDHKAEGDVPRPPFSFTESMISTRLFHGNIRKQVFVRSLGKATSSPLLLIHGHDNCSHGRDLFCFVEPLVELGYRVIIPDLPGYGKSPGRRDYSHADEYLKEGGYVHILEDVLRSFGWFPNGQAGNSHTNGPLDILGVSSGFSLALTFALKHGNITNISHKSSDDVGIQSRIGTIVSLNGIHRSGYKDQNMLIDALSRGDKPPTTATEELKKLSPHIKVLVLSVGPDLEHPRSLSSELATKIQQCVFEEVDLLKAPKSKLNPKASISLPSIRPLGNSRSQASGSDINELRALSRHCFETHSNIIVPRVVNWLLQWGTAAAQAVTKGEEVGPAKMLAPLRTGLVQQTGPSFY